MVCSVSANNSKWNYHISSHTASGHIPKRIGCRVLNRYLHTGVYRSLPTAAKGRSNAIIHGRMNEKIKHSIFTHRILLGLENKGNTNTCSVQFSSSLQPHGLQHTWPPCPSPTPRVYSNSCPLSRRCHPTVSSSVISFFSRLQSFPASGSFPVSQFFASGDQSIGVSSSAPVLPVNIQD